MSDLRGDYLNWNVLHLQTSLIHVPNVLWINTKAVYFHNLRPFLEKSLHLKYECDLH